MNTATLPTRISPGATAPALRIADFGIAQSREPAHWLPAPPVHRKTLAPLPVTPTRLWTVAARPSASERILFGLLAAGALAAIGYGLICMLNLVQNWAVFHANIASLVQ